jgi:alpha-tubulin suppressor-like RCC1 family protein
MTKLTTGTKVTGLFAGCSHALALTSTGKVLAWGDGGFGVLDNGFTVDKELPTAVKLPAGRSATAIASGSTAQASLAILRP